MSGRMLFEYAGEKFRYSTFEDEAELTLYKPEGVYSAKVNQGLFGLRGVTHEALTGAAERILSRWQNKLDWMAATGLSLEDN